ncbi:uncharacterized protein BO66DRAFT_100004 [Aspergillus aculeatinus CBS 121060]|uniref:Uncharacterized protein n=1 Tax=Aspergillus aculeatinus CBS 121060 TaxID=1448322 RepID=A0ACD1H7W3_9EURO|nr:hypothetical protein BO66DRAFT_100004 [Aspergillus aculeatinus CBS 121060]RAH69671.1 hypothetical protein BO66DRAFT_100004 [Aspergillus aculeatinus CBS 121060]
MRDDPFIVRESWTIAHHTVLYTNQKSHPHPTRSSLIIGGVILSSGFRSLGTTKLWATSTIEILSQNQKKKTSRNPVMGLGVGSCPSLFLLWITDLLALYYRGQQGYMPVDQTTFFASVQ